MRQFSMNIFLSQIGRISTRDVQKLIEEHSEDLQRMSIVDANQILNFIDKKFKIVSGWQDSEGMVDIITFKMIATRIPDLSRKTFEEIDNGSQLLWLNIDDAMDRIKSCENNIV